MAANDVTTTLAPERPVTTPPGLPSGTAVEGAAVSSEGNDSGTLYDPANHAAGSRADFLVSVRHVTEVQQIDERLERNQHDLGQVTLVPGFKLLHRIGKGAFGTVWEAQSVDNDEERVAVKFFTRSQWEPMYREVSRIARLEGCSGVMPFKQYADKKADPPYYVMPFARNGSLADMLKKRGPLPVREALALFGRVVETMAFVHAKGVIHCDLKPANIMLNESGEPLVADFGQAQLGSQEPGSFGTLFYMPPEQAEIRKNLPDSNWDVYALGAILFELLTGRRPRTSETLAKKLGATSDIRDRLDTYRRELLAMSKVGLREAMRAAAPANVKDLDAGLETLVEDCLAIEPSRRPRSAGQLRERLQKRDAWNKRRSKLIAAGAATVLFFVLIAGFGVFSAERIYAKRRAQQAQFVEHSLQQTSHIAGQLVEELLQDRVSCANRVAEGLAGHSDLLDNLDDLRAKFRGRPGEAHAALTEAERAKYAGWLAAEARKQMPWYDTQTNSRAIGIQLLVDDGCFLLTQLQRDGSPDLAFADGLWQERFKMDWAWRDYYAARGNHFDMRGRPVKFEPIRQCHITHVYRSMAQGKPMRIDVAAPVKGRGGETVAIVILAIDVQDDLFRRIGYDPDSTRPEIDGRIVLVNDRHCWAAHPLAHRSRTFEGDCDPEPVFKDFEWARAKAAGRVDYVDPLAGEPCRAAYVPIHPFKCANDTRQWLLLAQMSDAHADRPAEEMRDALYSLGATTMLVLGGVVAVLWAWWIRTLKRQELLAHG